MLAQPAVFHVTKSVGLRECADPPYKLRKPDGHALSSQVQVEEPGDFPECVLRLGSSVDVEVLGV